MSNKISSDIKDSIKNYVKYDDYIKEQEKKLRKILSTLSVAKSQKKQIEEDIQKLVDIEQKILDYDLYLLDINVPDMSGIELLKLLRTSNDNTPTIFLTSYKDKNTLKECFISGADDFLQKPVDLDELILRIYSVLKRSGKQIQDIILPNGLSFNVKNKRLFKDKKDLNLASSLDFEIMKSNITQQLAIDSSNRRKAAVLKIMIVLRPSA